MIKKLLLLLLSPFVVHAAETGWSEFKPSIDSKIIYVSSSGKDTNPGTITLPVKTASHAVTLTKDGHPDQILFKRGDTFWGYPKGLNGRSGSEPFVMGAYGVGERPIFNIEPSTQMNGCGQYRVFSSMHFLNYKRDPQKSNPVAESSDDDGIVCIWKSAHDIRFEDMKWEFFRLAAYYDAVKGPGIYNIIFYRNLYKDAWSAGKGVRDRKAQGSYLHTVKGAQWIENIFYRNGWSPYRPEPRSYLNHSLYICDMADTVVRGNISALSSALAFKFNTESLNPGTSNLTVENNFAIGAANGISVTSNAAILNSYKNIKVINNVQTHIGADAQVDGGAIVPQGLGMRLQEIQGLFASGNIFVDKTYKTSEPAIDMKVDSGSLIVQNNIVYHYSKAGIHGSSDPSNMIEPSADKLTDATRNINTYFGVADGEKVLYARLPSMRKGNWDSKFTAPVINDWIRAGIKRK